MLRILSKLRCGAVGLMTVISLSACEAQQSQSPQEAGEALRASLEPYAIMDIDVNYGNRRKAVRDRGEDAFPAIEYLLQTSTDRNEVRALLSIIQNSKEDCSRFLDEASAIATNMAFTHATRAEAVTLLYFIGDLSVCQTLMAIVQDPEEEAQDRTGGKRVMCCRALGLHGDETTADALEAYLSKRRDKFKDDADIMDPILRAGDKAVVEIRIRVKTQQLKSTDRESDKSRLSTELAQLQEDLAFEEMKQEFTRVSHPDKRAALEKALGRKLQLPPYKPE